MLDDEYMRELNEAYNHFFFHYNATPLLVVETSQFDLTWGDEALDDLSSRSAAWARARGTTCRERSDIAVGRFAMAVWFTVRRSAWPDRNRPRLKPEPNGELSTANCC